MALKWTIKRDTSGTERKVVNGHTVLLHLPQHQRSFGSWLAFEPVWSQGDNEVVSNRHKQPGAARSMHMHVNTLVIATQLPGNRSQFSGIQILLRGRPP